MNGLTETVFNFLLGWVKKLFEDIWNLFSSQEGTTWLDWLTDNWLALVVVLCVGGLIVDLLVWFFRWRPDYVWRSGLRRFKSFFKRGSHNKGQAFVDNDIEDPQYLPYAGAKNPNIAKNRQNKGEYNGDIYEGDTYYKTAPQAPPYSYEEQTMAYTPAPMIGGGNDDETRQMPLQKSVGGYQSRPVSADLSLDYIEQYAKPEGDNLGEASLGIQETQVLPQYTQGVPQVSELSKHNEIHKYNETLENNEVSQYTDKRVQENRKENPLSGGGETLQDTQDFDWGKTPLANQQGYYQPYTHEELVAPGTVDFDYQGEDTLETPAMVQNTYLQDPQKLLSETAPYPRRRRRSAQHNVSGLAHLSKSIGSIAKKAGDALQGQDSNNQLLDGLPPPVDKDKAFHQPVYPVNHQKKTRAYDQENEQR